MVFPQPGAAAPRCSGLWNVDHAHRPAFDVFVDDEVRPQGGAQIAHFREDFVRLWRPGEDGVTLQGQRRNDLDPVDALGGKVQAEEGTSSAFRLELAVEEQIAHVVDDRLAIHQLDTLQAVGGVAEDEVHAVLERDASHLPMHRRRVADPVVTPVDREDQEIAASLSPLPKSLHLHSECVEVVLVHVICSSPSLLGAEVGHRRVQAHEGDGDRTDEGTPPRAGVPQ